MAKTIIDEIIDVQKAHAEYLSLLKVLDRRFGVNYSYRNILHQLVVDGDMTHLLFEGMLQQPANHIASLTTGTSNNPSITASALREMITNPGSYGDWDNEGEE